MTQTRQTRLSAREAFELHLRKHIRSWTAWELADEMGMVNGVYVSYSTAQGVLRKLHQEGKVGRMRSGPHAPYVYWWIREGYPRKDYVPTYEGDEATLRNYRDNESGKEEGWTTT